MKIKTLNLTTTILFFKYSPRPSGTSVSGLWNLLSWDVWECCEMFFLDVGMSWLMLYIALQGETVKMVIVYHFISDEDSNLISNEEQLYFEIICIITFSAISKCDFSCAHYVYVLEAFIMWEKHIWMHACVLQAFVNHFLYQLEVILYDVSFFIFGFLMLQDLFSFFFSMITYIFGFFTMIQNIYFRFSLWYKILRTKMVIVMII